MEATITLRKGCPPGEAQTIRMSTPALEPGAWLTRQDAADILNVGPRTIDRYLRKGSLSFYRGPVPREDGSPGGGNGVRIWQPDVESYPYRHDVTVVTQ